MRLADEIEKGESKTLELKEILPNTIIHHQKKMKNSLMSKSHDKLGFI
jgi:hypothetical protein